MNMKIMLNVVVFFILVSTNVGAVNQTPLNKTEYSLYLYHQERIDRANAEWRKQQEESKLQCAQWRDIDGQDNSACQELNLQPSPAPCPESGCG